MGGTERHLAELANYQQNVGHEVIIMLRGCRKPYGGDDPFLQWLDKDIKIINAPKIWPFSRWPLLPIKWQLRKLTPDIIHTHHGRDSRYLAKASAGNIPVVATLHMPYRARDFARHDGLICVSQWQMEDLPADIIANSVVIPNWVKPTLKLSTKQQQQLRAKIGVKSSEFVIGVVGRLVMQKGIDLLIDAFAQVDLPNCHLCIFGDGEMAELLAAKIDNYGCSNIHLMGYEHDIRPWYSIFDLFILPSRQETFGLVLLEAMVAGCPILTTRTSGAEDILGNNKQVLWAETNDLTTLKQALRKIPNILGQRWVYPELKNHDFECAMHKVLEFYQRFI